MFTCMAMMQRDLVNYLPRNILMFIFVASASVLASLRAWLISVDDELLDYEEWLIQHKFFNPKRLRFFTVVEAAKIGIALCDKNMLLAAIAELPNTVAWPLPGHEPGSASVPVVRLKASGCDGIYYVGMCFNEVTIT